MSIFSPENYFYNFIALPKIIVGCFVFIVGFIVFFKDPRNKTHSSFFIFTLFISLWFLNSALNNCVINKEAAFFWAKLNSVWIALIPPSVFAFSLILLDWPKYHKKIIYISLIFVFFIICIPFNLVISSVELVSSAEFYHSRAGPFGVFFLIVFLVVTFYTFSFYIRALMKQDLPLIKHAQIRFVFIAFLIGHLSAMDFLKNFGIMLFPYSGLLPIVVFITMIAYAIFRYQLFHISQQIIAAAAMETMADVLLVTNKEGIIVIVNKAAKRMLIKNFESNNFLFWRKVNLIGLSVKQFIKQYDEYWQIASVNNIHKEIVSAEEENNFISLEGNSIPVSLSVSVIRDDTKQVIGLAFVGHDLRVIKKAIHQLEIKKKELGNINKTLQNTGMALIRRTAQAEELNNAAYGREQKLIELQEQINKLEKIAVAQMA